MNCEYRTLMNTYFPVLSSGAVYCACIGARARFRCQRAPACATGLHAPAHPQIASSARFASFEGSDSRVQGDIRCDTRIPAYQQSRV